MTTRPPAFSLSDDGLQLAKQPEGDGPMVDGVDLSQLGGPGDPFHAVHAKSGLLIARATGDKRPGSWVAADLRQVPVLDLLEVVVNRKMSGAFEVDAREGRRTVFFDRGRYTGCLTSFHIDRLGQVLWREGLITRDQLNEAAAAIEPSKRLGRILVDMKAITPKILHNSLKLQAWAVLESAALTEDGEAVFRTGLAHPRPLQVSEGASALLSRLGDLSQEYAQLKTDLPPLTEKAEPTPAPPSGTLGDQQNAVWQLIQKEDGPTTFLEVARESGLGMMHALRVLRGLVKTGFVQAHKFAGQGATQDLGKRVEGMCEAINIAVQILDEDGLGGGKRVRDYVAEPPPQLKEGFENLSFTDDGLDPSAVKVQANFVSGGLPQMAAVLQSLLDYALFESRDTLPDKAMADLLGKIMALDVDLLSSS
jgi:hypothetical protein